VGPVLAIAAGALAVIAVGLKPHYAIVPLLLAWWGGFGSPGRLLHPEFLTLAAGLLLYLVLVVVAAPDYLAMVRLLAPVYWDYHRISFMETLIRPWVLLPLLLSLGILLVRPGQPAVTSLALAAVCCAFVAVVQAKGWDNHALPAAAFALLALGMLWGHPVAAALIGGVLTLAAIQTPPDPPPARGLAAYLHRHARPGDPIAILTGASFTPVRLADEGGNILATRFQSLWPLGGIYHAALAARGARVPFNRPAEMGAAERAVYDATLEDLGRRQAAVIAIKPEGPELTGLNLLDYFGQDERLSRILERYEPREEVDGGYLVWRLRDRR
jgi:hypothetical protein